MFLFAVSVADPGIGGKWGDPSPLSAALSLPCPPLPQNSPLKFSWGLGSPVSSHRGPGARRQTPLKGILSPKNRFWL